MTISIGTAFGNGRSNNFDIIRLIAATVVIVSHSYPLTGTAEPFIPYIVYANAGGLSVAVFFAISGFLVTRSVERNNVTDYMSARILRIFPGLFFALMFDALIVGPYFTTLPLKEYFAGYSFQAHIRSIFLFTLDTALPGVFEHNPFPTWVNGSLWSLPYEFLLYLFLPMIFIIGGLKRNSNWILFIFSITAYFLAKSGIVGLTYGNQGTPIFGSVYPYLVLEYAPFFIIGSSLWVYREKIPMSPAIIFILFALSWAGANMKGGYIFYCLLVPYTAIWAALRLPKVNISKIGDISYGVYIYAFPVQQSIVAINNGKISPTSVTLITIPIVFSLAYISYRFIERPAMRLRVFLRSDRKSIVSAL